MRTIDLKFRERVSFASELSTNSLLQFRERARLSSIRVSRKLVRSLFSRYFEMSKTSCLLLQCLLFTEVSAKLLDSSKHGKMYGKYYVYIFFNTYFSLVKSKYDK